MPVDFKIQMVEEGMIHNNFPIDIIGKWIIANTQMGFLKTNPIDKKFI